LSAREIAAQVGLRIQTFLKAFTRIRESIVVTTPRGAALLSGEVGIDEASFGGRIKGKQGKGERTKLFFLVSLNARGILVHYIRDKGKA
jgi:hypothetical protein